MIRAHDIVLADGPLTLRPMTEDDWDLLLRWNNDPEVLRFAEGDEVLSRTLEEVQAVYRGVSQRAFMFTAELEGRPIGECWLQEMNLRRILGRFPKEADLRRIDLVIGETELWGHGWGSRMIALLVGFGFQRKNAGAIFACDISDQNPRSLRAFAKNGFVEFQGHAGGVRDLVLRVEQFERSNTASARV
ncbi:MAG: GNAT family N-acetyltransferase [Planctomycetota bacterium]